MSTKRFIILASIFIVVAACSNMKRLTFRYDSNSQRHKMIMQVPKHGKMITITAGGEGKEYRYECPDSSIIYISDLKASSTINEDLIRKQEGAYNLRFVKDSASFEGINSMGNCWKEIKNKGLYYGYYNVPPPKKQLFDEAIRSIKFY